MVNWIRDFSNYYRDRAHRHPVIYTTTDWWKNCTGGSPVFGSTNPLWIAHYASAVGPLPNGWGAYTFWQYAQQGLAPGNQDYYNGNAVGLKKWVTFASLLIRIPP